MFAFHDVSTFIIIPKKRLEKKNPTFLLVPLNNSLISYYMGIVVAVRHISVH